MLYLLGSIVFTTYLGIFFKVSGRYGLNTLHVIVFNYITCVIVGFFMQPHAVAPADMLQHPWMLWAVAMGVGFITLFNLIGFSTQRIGIAVTSVAYKLSLIIPFAFSVFLFKEHIPAIKWGGIALAVPAVILTCYHSGGKSDAGKLPPWMYIVVPVIIFTGSGLLDTAIKYTEYHFLNGENNDSFLVAAFGCAAICGMVALVFNILSNKRGVAPAAVWAGVLLGVPNYFSIWCLVAALQSYPGVSSVIIPVNNMAVVLLSAIIAWFFFREKLSLVNWTGIALALISIALIAI